VRHRQWHEKTLFSCSNFSNPRCKREQKGGETGRLKKTAGRNWFAEFGIHFTGSCANLSGGGHHVLPREGGTKNCAGLVRK
jgi:hypothetical protein